MYHRTTPGMPPDPGEAWYYVMLEPQHWHGWTETRRGLYATRKEAEAARAKDAEERPWCRFTELARLPLWKPKEGK